MHTEIWKNRLMPLCMSILILGFFWIVLYAAVHGLVKLSVRKHPALYDVAIVRLVLTGDHPDDLFKQKKKDHSIDWAALYPFDPDRETHPKPIAFPPKRSSRSPADKLSSWANHNLPGYYTLAEGQHAYDARIYWDIVNPANNVMSLGNGYWAALAPKMNVTPDAQAVISLSRFAASQGIPLLYVQKPHKINKYGDARVNGHYDFANNNDDRFLAQLKENGVDSLDLRDFLHQMAPTDEEYHRLFFRTDHHWLPQTALLAARFLAGTLQQKYGIDADLSALEPENFQIDWLPGYFLGSQGKKVTLARAKPDDFPILHSKYHTKVHMKLPSKGLDITGPFEVTYETERIAYKDYYDQVPYDLYGYGNPAYISIENLSLSNIRNQKILMLKDSFGSSLMPLMSLGCKHIVAIDTRAFTGSLHALIRKEKPDVIVVEYMGSSAD